jgi:hypothetical protein
LGPQYGAGKWKWREPGTQVWYDYNTIENATMEYNYRRGVRGYKFTSKIGKG